MQTVVGVLGMRGAGKDTFANQLVTRLGFKRIAFADALYQEAAAAYGVSAQFLGVRETKETDLPELRLSRCVDEQFVEVAAAHATRDRRLRTAALELYRTGKLTTHVSRRRQKALLKAGRSPRWVLQLWGTDYRRRSRFGVDSYWLDKVRAVIEHAPQTNFVIPDVRFRNEVAFVRSFEGPARGLLIRIRRPSMEAAEALRRKKGGLAAHPSETELLNQPVDEEIINYDSSQPWMESKYFRISRRMAA